MHRQSLTLAIALLAVSVAVAAQTTSAVPPGPMVYDFEGEYHLADCERLVGAAAQTIALRDAVRQLRTACSTCKPVDRDLAVRSFIANHTAAIGREAAAEREAAALGRPIVRLAETQVREIATRVAQSDELGEKSFASLFQREVRILAPDYVDGGVLIHSAESFGAVLLGPVAAFGTAAAERVRKMEPVAETPWVPHATVHISVNTIDAPDIEKIVLGRDGNIVEPTLSALKPTPMKTRMGLELVVHTGFVAFPLVAFEPGAQSVVLTLIPARGSNIVKRLAPSDLRRIY